MDLSFPHGASVNDETDGDLISLYYRSVNHVAEVGSKAGLGSPVSQDGYRGSVSPDTRAPSGPGVTGSEVGRKCVRGLQSAVRFVVGTEAIQHGR